MAKKRKQRVVLDAAQRAEVALKLDKGAEPQELAEFYHVAVSTIGKIGKKARSDHAPEQDRVREAIVFLKQAQRQLINNLQARRLKEPDGPHLLMMMALRTLEGAA